MQAQIHHSVDAMDFVVETQQGISLITAFRILRGASKMPLFAHLRALVGHLPIEPLRDLTLLVDSENLIGFDQVWLVGSVCDRDVHWNDAADRCSRPRLRRDVSLGGSKCNSRGDRNRVPGGGASAEAEREQCRDRRRQRCTIDPTNRQHSSARPGNRNRDDSSAEFG